MWASAFVSVGGGPAPLFEFLSFSAIPASPGEVPVRTNASVCRGAYCCTAVENSHSNSTPHIDMPHAYLV